MPALFTSAVDAPECAASSNMRTTSASRATSPATALAAPALLLDRFQDRLRRLPVAQVVHAHA
jgi:hypothetical protein